MHITTALPPVSLHKAYSHTYGPHGEAARPRTIPASHACRYDRNGLDRNDPLALMAVFADLHQGIRYA